MDRSAYALYFAANLAPRALMFALMVVLTHLMPIAEYGMFVLVITTGEILDMGLGNWVRIFALRCEGVSVTMRPRRLGRLIALTAAMTFVALVLTGLGSLAGERQAGAFTLGVAAYLLAFATLRLGLILLQIQRKHSAYAAVEAVRSVSTLASATFATLLVGPNFLAVALAFAGATFFAGVIGLFIALRGASRPQRARSGYLASLVFGLPIILASALGYSLGWLDRFIVNLLVGPHGVAVFAATYALARQPIELFLGPMNNYAFPHLVHSYEHEGAGAAAQIQAGLLTTLTMIGSAIAASLMFLAVPLLEFVLPPDYQADGARIVPWMAAGTLFLALKLFVFDNVFHISKRTWLLPLAMTPPAVLSVALSLLLIPHLGMAGAGISYGVAGGLALLTTALVTARILPTAIPWLSFARIAAANLCASAVLLGLRGLLAGAGPLPILLGCTLGFTLTYAAALTGLGVSIRQALSTPWAPWAERPAPAGALIPTRDGAAR